METDTQPLPTIAASSYQAYRLARGADMPEYAEQDPDFVNAWQAALECLTNKVQGAEEGSMLSAKELTAQTYHDFRTAMQIEEMPLFAELPTRAQVAWEAAVRHAITVSELEEDVDLAEHEAFWSGWAEKKLAEVNPS